MADECGMKMCVRGYHVYRSIWEVAVGEMLSCVRESRKAHDRYAVTVKKNGTVRRRTLAQEGLVCLRSISDRRREYSVYCHWKTKIFGRTNPRRS